jgi:Protein of unknown function (DUF2851)
VVNPGRRGGGSGPDFLDAVVLLDGVERRGDVELHVRASSFRGHGHEADPAYDGVALHVVYQGDETETRLNSGATAPVAAFAPWLEGRSRELESWLAAPEIWQEPCRGVSARLGVEAVRQALEVAGRGRFESRVARLAAEIEAVGAEQALWRALLDALGVGGDREGFRRLAEALPVSMAAGAKDLEAALLYVAGLAEAPVDEALPPPLRPGLQSFGRPANRPQGRLSGLAGLWARASGSLVDYAAGSVGTAGKTSELLAAWQVGDGRIGPGRAQELLVNAVLPFAAAQGFGNEALRLMLQLPAAVSYGKTAFLESNLRPEKGRIVRNAVQSQGLLGYLGEWCSQGGCGRCPLSRDGAAPHTP